MVDENGEPLVAYHGSGKWFTTFDGGAAHHSGAPDGTVWLSSSREVANSFIAGNWYGDSKGEKSQLAHDTYLDENDPRHRRYGWGTYREGGIYPVYVKMSRPLVVDFKGNTWRDSGDGRDINKIVADAKSTGRYDGVIAKNIKDVGVTDLSVDEVATSTDYVVFDNTSVKSATDNSGAFSRENADIRYRRVDVNEMSREDIARRGEKLRAAETVPLKSGIITASNGKSALRSALEWWDSNIGKKLTYDTEAGQLDIDRASVRASLSHGYSQKNLDAVATLPVGFGNAVYLGSAKDLNGNDLDNHYFAYPVSYDGERQYVFCRARSDMNKGHLYLHEVYTEKEIEEAALQAGAHNYERSRGSILYKDILSGVLGANVEKVSETDGLPLQYFEGENAVAAHGGDETGVLLREGLPGEGVDGGRALVRGLKPTLRWAGAELAELERKAGVRMEAHTSAETLPAEAREALRAGRRVMGAYDPKTGKVHLYMPNIHSRYELERTVAHEVVGHKGLRELLGQEGHAELMRALYMGLSGVKSEEVRGKGGVKSEDVRGKNEAALGAAGGVSSGLDWIHGRMQTNGWDLYEAMDEYCARQAELDVRDVETERWWQTAVRTAGDVLRRLGYRLRPRERDVREMHSERHSSEPAAELRFRVEAAEPSGEDTVERRSRWRNALDPWRKALQDHELELKRQTERIGGLLVRNE